MSNATPPRNTTRVRLMLPEADNAVVQRALEQGIRTAIADPAAVVGWYAAADGEDLVVTVRQETGKWWAMMPASFAEMLGGYQGTATMRWRDDEPPKAIDD